MYPGRFFEAISHLDSASGVQSAHALFAHQEFFGAKMGAIISQQGDKWPHHYPLVISGHIHDYGRPQHNIIYTGTPMQHAFGDHNNKTISEYVFYPSAQQRNITINGSDSTSQTTPQPTLQTTPQFISQPTEGSGEDIEWKENRLDLGLVKRVICYVRPDEIMTWVPPENKLVKMVIRGTVPEIKAVTKLVILMD